jgi:hypothetical protein
LGISNKSATISPPIQEREKASVYVGTSFKEELATNPEAGNNQQLRIEDLEEEEADNGWAQLLKMERFLEQQRLELLQQGVPDSDDEDWDGPQWPDETEDGLDKEEDDSLENEDLTLITSVLDSFSKPKSEATKLNGSRYEILTPEGATEQAEAK